MREIKELLKLAADGMGLWCLDAMIFIKKVRNRFVFV